MSENPTHHPREPHSAGSHARPQRPPAPPHPPPAEQSASPGTGAPHRPAAPPDPAIQARRRRRATFIPVLLTLTFMLPAMGIGWFALDVDSPLKAAGRGAAIALIIGGVLLAPLTWMNMASARRES